MEKHVVGAIFVDPEGNTILQDRRKENNKFGETESFYGGGKKDGETSIETVIREIKEELGLMLNENQLLPIDNEFVHNVAKKDGSGNVEYHRTLFVVLVENCKVLQTLDDRESKLPIILAQLADIDDEYKYKFNTNVMKEKAAILELLEKNNNPRYYTLDELRSNVA